MNRYDVIYRDHDGELEGSLYVGVNTFALEVGGVRFEGRLDGLEPVSHEPWAELGRFRLDGYNALARCELMWSQPMQVLRIADHGVSLATLHARICQAGSPEAYSDGRVEAAELWLYLERGGELLEGQDEYYVDALEQITGQLPDEQLLCCWGCDLSDYSPAGQSVSGALMCFVEHAEEYRAIDSGRALLQLMHRVGYAQLRWVNETHVCDRFEPRRPQRRGYRG
jgi:hypothetical protein